MEKLFLALLRPVCVESIAGPYRKGKSYFLSEAFDQPEVFPLGHEMVAETMGIRLWIVPKKYKVSNNLAFHGKIQSYMKLPGSQCFGLRDQYEHCSSNAVCMGSNHAVWLIFSSLHEQLDLHKFSRGKYGAKKCKRGRNQRQRWEIPHLHSGLHGVVKFVSKCDI